MVPSSNNLAAKVNNVYFGLPQEKSTPLIIAAKRGYPEIVDALLADGRADVNIRNKVKQRDAYSFCPWLNPDYPSALLQHGSTALTWASWNINNETVIALLGRPDIDVNMQDGVSFCNFSFPWESSYNLWPSTRMQDKWSALIHACEKGRTDSVKSLLQHPDIQVNAFGGANVRTFSIFPFLF